MLVTINRILLCFMLCLVLASYSGCPHDACIKYQDIAQVGLSRAIGYGESFHIDSISVRVNDSITGCGNPRYSKRIGSKTHNVKFPINVRVQLFAQGDLWEEFFFEMDKNTMLSVYNRVECSSTSESTSFFRYRMKLAKEQNRFIDSSLTDDYCWLFEKMGDSYDDDRCTEWQVMGESDPCNGRY
jgi:hypothetical protein